MYQLRFYQDNLPPVLNNRTNDIQYKNYIIGAPNDPHWKLYPKNQFLTARNVFPIGYAFTDYSADANHYVYYMPESDGLTMVYSRLLREHYERFHKYKQEANKEQFKKQTEEKNEKIKQLKILLKEQKSQLKRFKEELAKLKSIRDRTIRNEVRSGTPRDFSERNYDINYPLYLNTLGSIPIFESNISTLEKELKTYTD